MFATHQDCNTYVGNHLVYKDICIAKLLVIENDKMLHSLQHGAWRAGAMPSGRDREMAFCVSWGMLEGGFRRGRRCKGIEG